MSGRAYDAGRPPPKPPGWQPIHIRSAVVTPEAPTHPDHSAEAMAHVAAVMAAFTAERSWNQPTGGIAEAAPVRARPLAPEHLLAGYEKLAASGDRAAQFRVDAARRGKGGA